MRTMHMLHSLDLDVWHEGVTVRKGFKWADVEMGEELDLCVCTRDPETHDVQGKGTVEGVWVGRFGELPASLIELEHEESSRVYSGLLESMRRAYGEDFEEDTFVTVVMYTRVS